MVLGLFNSPQPYLGQKYSALKKTAKKSGTLFTDPEFPVNDKALFYSHSSNKITGIEWKRPKVSEHIFQIVKTKRKRKPSFVFATSSGTSRISFILKDEK